MSIKQGKILKILAVLWAWFCWIWVACSRDYLWLIVSIIPYFIVNSISFDDELTKK